jgi:hypothetical protein
VAVAKNLVTFCDVWAGVPWLCVEARLGVVRPDWKGQGGSPEAVFRCSGIGYLGQTAVW